MQLPVFHTARLKLTAWYVFIIFIIIAVFSGAIDLMLTREVHRFSDLQRQRLENSLRENLVLNPSMMQEAVQILSDLEFEQQIVRRIHFLILVIDGSILVVSAYVAYNLAGKSLQPIHLMMEEQQRFISDASHELKTPLTALRTTMEVSLRNPKLTLSQAKQTMEDNLVEIQGLQKLSEALLRSHSYDGDEESNFKKIHLDKIIEKVIKTVSPLATQKKINFVTSLKKVSMVGNETQLKELLMILLDNAIKYSPEKSIISIKLSKRLGKIYIQIIDQGIGIDRKDMPRIFDRFYKTDLSRNSSNSRGYGLGLSIAKQIVDIHQGEIQIKSTVSKGSTFTVSFPTSIYG